MTTSLWYSLVGVGLFCLGIHALLVRAELAGKLIALNVSSAGVFLLLVAIGHRGGAAPDPVPQALVLTGLVVSVSTTALALAIARRLAESEAAERGPGQDGT